MKPARLLLLISLGLLTSVSRGQTALTNAPALRPARPNILIAISDDQSYLHTSIAGYKAIHTPAFDRVAREGVLFRNCFAASPGCSPSRASLLTGRHPWQIEQAGTHDSNFPTNYDVFPDLLEANGYAVGFTGKGWGPGNWKISGRTRNPAGPEFGKRKLTPPTTAISHNDYTANFKDFLATRTHGQPFCFWFGAHEPHRDYEKGSGLKAGLRLEDMVVPPSLPDTPEVRSDILDYCLAIQWFDTQLSQMLKMLEAAGELENTIIIVTSDNGMPFPRAKANCYEDGIHVPLAIRWGAQVPGGRTVDDVVGFVDLTATVLAATGTKPPTLYPLSGHSLLNTLTVTNQGLVDSVGTVAWAARERHSSSRYDNWTYPQRALRTAQFLYVRNFKPGRWPAGDPQEIKANGKLGPANGAYYDIDIGPTRDLLLHQVDDPVLGPFFQLAVAKRPAEELFDIRKDPGCLKNLAGEPAFAKTKGELSRRLLQYLEKTGDARVLGHGDIWETYPRYSSIRKFPPLDYAK